MTPWGLSMEIELVRRRFTVDEYTRMVEAGILTKDDRVELLDGEIVQMPPSGREHSASIAVLTRLFVSGLGPRAVVWPQLPVELPPRSMPEPDVALLRPRSYRSAYPTPGDVLLVVEVAETSLARDRKVKLPLYARAGIPEVWIVDVEGEEVEVYSSPRPDGYASVERFGRARFLSPAAFRDLVIPIDEIFA